MVLAPPTNIYLLIAELSVFSSVALVAILLILNWRHWRIYLVAALTGSVAATSVMWIVLYISGAPFNIQ
jgi:hypothetical protein